MNRVVIKATGKCIALPKQQNTSTAVFACAEVFGVRTGARVASMA